jgi:hypothetical protein
MDTGIRFPSEQEVIDDNFLRFHRLTETEKFEQLNSTFNLYHWLMDHSAHPENYRKFAEEQEVSSRKSLMEFIGQYE